MLSFQVDIFFSEKIRDFWFCWQCLAGWNFQDESFPWWSSSGSYSFLRKTDNLVYSISQTTRRMGPSWPGKRDIRVYKLAVYVLILWRCVSLGDERSSDGCALTAYCHSSKLRSLVFWSPRSSGPTMPLISPTKPYP